MANIFTLENISDFSEKINLDDLYEKKRSHDLNKLDLYNKILNRIHVRIKTTSRQKIDEHFCWYVVPEIIIGVPKFDQGTCIAYLMDKLKDNKFQVRYIHPNTLFISWQHWIPSYVRTELKKKTGIVIDEFGRKIEEQNDDKILLPNYEEAAKPQNNHAFKLKESTKQIQQKKFTPIRSYKPSGNLIYDEELFSTLENKLN
uniref:Uncharacterized protein n=1 Tax=viral metagenome TaxID=1070528 RepID=A0A6C0LB72_9ZZZZ